MSSIVLVTKQCYLICESINFITVHEMGENEKEELFYDCSPTRRKKKLSAKQRLLEKVKKKSQLYQIVIDFIPTSNNVNGSSKPRNSSDGTAIVSIPVRGQDQALELYKDMIGQIREQSPDKLFLDRMVEKFFAANPEEE